MRTCDLPHTPLRLRLKRQDGLRAVNESQDADQYRQPSQRPLVFAESLEVSEHHVCSGQGVDQHKEKKEYV